MRLPIPRAFAGPELPGHGLVDDGAHRAGSESWGEMAAFDEREAQY
jgi:hypothetical protein